MIAQYDYDTPKEASIRKNSSVRLDVETQFRLVTDRQTDRQTNRQRAIVSTALPSVVRVKTRNVSYLTRCMIYI